MSRKPEIEAKRQRLAELRRQREEKEKALRDGQQPGDNHNHNDIHNDKNKNTDTDIDELVNGLIGDKRQHREISVQTEAVVQVRTYNKGTQTTGDDSDDDTQHEDQQEEEGSPEVIHEVIEDEDSSQDTHPLVLEDSVLSSFLAKSFTILNRAIEEDDDITQQYTLHKSMATTEHPQPYSLKHKLKQSHTITSLDTSAHFPHLIAICSDKSIMLYNLSFGKYDTEFRAHTKLMYTQFSQFQANLLMATGYNGKVHVWNLTTLDPTPYLTSPVSQQTHSYPILTMDQIDENNGVVITVSTDGKIIHWNPQILAKPSQPPIKLELPKRLSLRYDELTPTAVTHLKNDHGFLIVGSEDGNIYKVKRFDQRLGNDTVDKIFKKHQGPVTAVDASQEWQQLFISSSMDWRVYLWDVSHDEPLLQIYKSNSIMGVCWRPGKPTQLAFIYEDSVEILDLSIDNVVPVCKIQAGEVLTSVKFTKDGDKLLVGGVKGGVYIYDLDINVKSDHSKFKRVYVST